MRKTSTSSRRERYLRISSMRELREVKRELNLEIEDRERNFKEYYNDFRDEFSPMMIINRMVRGAETVASYIHSARAIFNRIKDIITGSDR